MEELVKFDPIKAQIEEAKKENQALVFDYEDAQGNKDARSHIFKLRKIKTKIADVHKIVKADALEYCRKVDAYKNDLTKEVEDMIDYHYKPIKAIEDREEAKKQAELKRMEEERLATEAKRQAELEAREKAVHEAEEKIRKEQEEKERIERERQIAEQARKDAEEKAKRDLEEAERKRLADIARIEAEQKAKELAELKKKQAEEEAERKRIENKKHREKIEKQTLLALKDYTTEKCANEILHAIIDGDIPNVTINY